MAITKTTNLGLQKIDSAEKLSAYPAVQQANMDILDSKTGSAADEAEYDRQDASGIYAGRSLITILGASGFDDAVSKLHAKVSKGDFTGLRVMDYLDVTPTVSTVNKGNSMRYRIGQMDYNYSYGDTATPHNVIMVPDAPVDMTGSTYAVNTSYIPWNTTSTNNGTADEANPYLASNLHKWELGDFLSALPTSLQDVLKSPRKILETRYSESAALTDSTSWAWKDLGKVFSLSETEVYGQCVWGTKGWSVGCDEQVDIFRKLRRRGMRSSRSSWWLRSVSSGSSSSVAFVNATGPASRTDATSGGFRPLPCFLVG